MLYTFLQVKLPRDLSFSPELTEDYGKNAFRFAQPDADDEYHISYFSYMSNEKFVVEYEMIPNSDPKINIKHVCTKQISPQKSDVNTKISQQKYD